MNPIVAHLGASAPLEYGPLSKTRVGVIYDVTF